MCVCVCVMFTGFRAHHDSLYFYANGGPLQPIPSVQSPSPFYGILCDPWLKQVLSAAERAQLFVLWQMSWATRWWTTRLPHQRCGPIYSTRYSVGLFLYVCITQWRSNGVVLEDAGRGGQNEGERERGVGSWEDALTVEWRSGGDACKKERGREYAW